MCARGCMCEREREKMRHDSATRYRVAIG